jgi:RNA polymerase sigma-70 factor (ECF subfamily)
MLMTSARPEDLHGALLMRIARGDRDALARLFDMEAGRLIAIARRIVRRPDLAEEVVQEAFVAAWQRASQYDPTRGPALAWLTTIVRNRALNLLRDSARVQPTEDGALAALAERQTDAFEAFDRLPEADALRHCLDKLEPDRREAILLCYVVGYTHEEVAARTSTPLGTVKAWIRRGMAALQECLA